jgi:CheY-like chemotaxis protein
VTSTLLVCVEDEGPGRVLRGPVGGEGFCQGPRRTCEPAEIYPVIEDNCDHAQTLLALLELEGYRVECVPDGVRGLKRVEEDLPDLIVLDFTLPDMSGADVGKALRSASRTARIPIIMGSGMPEWVVRRYFSDFNAFLAKPLDPEQLVKQIATLTAVTT